MAKDKAKKKGSKSKKPTKGLTPKVSKGLSKKKIEAKGDGKFVKMEYGEPVPLQFLTDTKGFRQYDNHSFQEDGKWHYVPCAGESCPLCEDESEQKSKSGYRFMCNVYNHKDKKVQILEGPKTLAAFIKARYDADPDTFTKRVFEITRFPTNPVTFNFGRGEGQRLKGEEFKSRAKRAHDLDEAIMASMTRYYGDKMPSMDALDDEDDDD